MKKKDSGGAEVNSSSMADIAFLLLVFFLVTTTIPNVKGLMIQLPPKQPDVEETKLADRNVLKVRINSADKLMVEDDPLDDFSKLKEMAKEHIMNPTESENMAKTPAEAVVSLKNDRGTRYETFITVLDQLQGAYYEIWGESVGLSADQYRNLDRANPEELELYELAKKRTGLEGMTISIAQPTSGGGN